MRLGIHASVRYGIAQALKETINLHCQTVQIFPRRPGTPIRFPSLAEKENIRQFRKKYSITPIIVHSVFQPNIASTNQKIWQRSRDSLMEEYQWATFIQAEFLIIHSGNYSADSTKMQGIQKSGNTIRAVLEQIPSNTKIIIENVPGGERRLGGKFEELRALLDSIGLPSRTGLCFDTAHAFSAGHPIQTETGLEDCLSELDKNIGLKFIEVFHINDCASKFGSHKDIHQHIGQGFIALAPLKKLVNYPQFVHHAGIIETPKLPIGSDELNLKQLMLTC